MEELYSSEEEVVNKREWLSEKSEKRLLFISILIITNDKLDLTKFFSISLILTIHLHKIDINGIYLVPKNCFHASRPVAIQQLRMNLSTNQTTKESCYLLSRDWRSIKKGRNRRILNFRIPVKMWLRKVVKSRI